MSAVMSAGYEVRNTIIWNKNLAQFGAIGAQYKSKHEPCLYCFKKGNSPYWQGPNNEVSVWDVARSSKNEFHPTQKPIGLPARAFGNSCPVHGLVLDLFLGSGTTLIAAEQLSRKCYGMEISPAYCDVIVKRWETLTGKKAIMELNG
jgi:DNA modification methylase